MQEDLMDQVTFDLKQESPSNVVCDVDVDEMESIPERMPIQQHRDAAPFEWRLPFVVAGLMVMDIVLLQRTS